MEFRHPLRKIFEHLLVLIEPSSSHGVSYALHSRKHKSYAVLSTAEDVVSCFLVKMAWLEPTEKGCTSHGDLHDPVRDLNIADLPRCE